MTPRLLTLARVAATSCALAAPVAAAAQPDDETMSAPTPPPDSRDPMEMGYWLQQTSERADAARAAGDHATAVQYYAELAKAVPDRSVAFARMCESYQALGRRDDALASCRDALARAGAQVADYVRFAHLVTGVPGELDPDEVADLDAALAHLAAHPAGRLTAYHLQCELGVRLADEPRLSACTAGLAENAPDDPKTVAFQWALALQRGDSAGAARLVDRAKHAGIEPAGVAAMERATTSAARSASGKPARSRGWWAIGAVALIVGGVAGRPLLRASLNNSRRRRARRVDRREGLAARPERGRKAYSTYVDD